MKLSRIAVALLCSLTSFAWAADGLITVKSAHGAKETMDKLEATAKAAGMNVFARIDHAAGAAKVDLQLRPTEVLIFGNPKGGTPFMQCAQTVGIDLPVKALVWKDESGQVWLGYNDPTYIATRHGAPDCKAAAGMSKALAGLVEKVVAK